MKLVLPVKNFNSHKKRKSMKTLFIIALLTIISMSTDAQWQPDVRLTNNPAVSYSGANNAQSVTANGDAVHVTWHDNRDANEEIYYKHSTDGGINWGTDIRLTDNSATSWNPSISATGQVVHIIWEDRRDGNSEIYYKRSSDGGLSWGTDSRLTNDPSSSFEPVIASSEQEVHVVWYDYRNGDAEIYYKRSTDAGVTWQGDVRLTNDGANSISPSITVSDQFVYVVWYDLRDGSKQIYFKRSTDKGVSWGADTRLTNNGVDSMFPTVSVFGQVVHVTWEDQRDGNQEIYYKRSTDGGSGWSADTRLTNNSAASESPSVTVSVSAVHIVWYDKRDGNHEIYHKRSTDEGISWEADDQLTQDPADSWNPSATMSGASVHVVWHDVRDGNAEMYYKRNPTGNPTNVGNITSEFPTEFELEQNYPNPFNPSTMISYQLPVSGFVKLKVYDILGKEVTTLVNEEKPTGSYEVEFSADGLTSGIYFYELTAGNPSTGSGQVFTETKKMILMK
jgi:hypothetical protein